MARSKKVMERDGNKMDTVEGSQNVLQAGGAVKFFAVCDEGDIDVTKILFVRIRFIF
jgi:hypothetical protein